MNHHVQYSSEWIPESRYYGDRYARTMQEAFGPYAELDVEPPGLFKRAMPYAAAVVCAIAIGIISWMVQ